MANIASIKVRKTNTVYGIQDAAASLAIEQMKNGTDIDSFGDVETALADKADASDLSAILDGTNIDSFGDVETALANCVTKKTDGGIMSSAGYKLGVQTPLVTTGGSQPELVLLYGNIEHGVTAPSRAGDVYDFAFPRSEQVVLGAKNLAENTLASQTKNGVTVTVNTNKTVNLNGTASTWTTLEVMRDLSGLVDFGDLILNGGFSDDGGSTSFLGIQKISAGSSLKYNGSAVIDKGNGVTFNLSGNLELMNGSSVTASELSVVLYINSGTTVTNKLYKPMLRLASDPDATYAPYAMTNKELTDAVKEIEAGKIEVSGNSATFNVPLIRANEHAYTYGLITFSGGLYHFWLKSSDESDAVIITKIIDANSSRTLSATYANGQLSLTFSATIYGGVMVETNNVVKS